MKVFGLIARKSLKSFLLLAFSLFLIIGVNNPVLAGGVDPPGGDEVTASLNVTPVYRLYDGWCWAACISSASSLFGTMISQVTIFHYIKDDPYNPHAYTPFANSLEIMSALSHFDMACTYSYTYMDYSTIVSTINNGRPSMAGIKYYTDGSGHIVLIRGYEYVPSMSSYYVFYMDPAYYGTNSLKTSVYADFLSNSVTYWDISFVGIHSIV